jgi:uncharacterized membrane protein YGL010W
MFRSIEDYMAEYGESHQHPTNKLIHHICVPIIFFSVVGILKALPVPSSWPIYLDFSSIMTVIVLFFYLMLKNLRVFVGMCLMILPMHILLEFLRPRFFLLSLGLFLVGWIVQFIGHKIEGKKPSFFKDLFFLLIGPIWVLKAFCQKIGVDLKISSAKEI